MGRVAVGRPAVVLPESRLPGCRRPCVAGAADLPCPVTDRSRRAAAAPEWENAWTREGVTMVRLPPTTDVIDLVVAVLGQAPRHEGGGSVLVLVPSTGWAERRHPRLERRGYPVARSWEEARAGWPVVVGSRAAAWAPVPRLAAAIVLDAHDAAYREETAPTYSAVDVVIERARREGVPCVLASPIPPVSMAADRSPTLTVSTTQERAGWPALEQVDRRGADPAPACSLTSSSAWPGPSSTMGRPGPGAVGVYLQPDRRGAAPGLPPLRGVCPLRAMWCGGGAPAGRGRVALPTLW